MEQIISSLLTNDLYKFSMGKVIYDQFPDYRNQWDFKCRNKNVKFTSKDLDDIIRNIDSYCNLKFTEDELFYLNSIDWLRGTKSADQEGTYISFLRNWRPRIEDFTVLPIGDCGLSITIKGSWLNISMYEMPILSIVSEVYFRNHYDYNDLFAEFKNRLEDKTAKLIDGTYQIGAFSEFGLRRRLSGEAQNYLVEKLVNLPKSDNYKFVGTSNVYLARKYGIKPIGTMAHEFVINVGQGNLKHNPAYSNWYAMDSWVKEYGILNGTYLTDTIGDECCKLDMGLTFSTLFSGVRHDSGDPYEWGDSWIDHFKKLGIDPKTKTLLFSDSLNFEKATAIYKYFKDRAKVAFGIGTYLANDTNVDPLNIVCKVASVNGHNVAKLSNVEGKTMCRNPEYVKYLQKTIAWRLDDEE